MELPHVIHARTPLLALPRDFQPAAPNTPVCAWCWPTLTAATTCTTAPACAACATNTHKGRPSLPSFVLRGMQ